MINHTSDEVWCMAGYTYSQQLAEAKNKAKKSQSFDEMVPEPYHEYKKVLSEEELEWLPEHQSWDHAIDLVPVIKHTCAVYNKNTSPVLNQILQVQAEGCGNRGSS